MHFANTVKKATPVYGAGVVLKAYNIDGDVRIKYRDQSDFENIASQFGIFQEWKVIQLCLFLTSQGQCIIICKWSPEFQCLISICRGRLYNGLIIE